VEIPVLVVVKQYLSVAPNGKQITTIREGSIESILQCLEAISNSRYYEKAPIPDVLALEQTSVHLPLL
jgi:hypothetical protein